MKIAILLPFKEDYTSKYSGAVSIHVSNLFKYSKFKKNIKIFGNTNYKNYLTKNFENIKINENFLTSSNKKYLNKFISYQQKNPVDIIEIHNRPNYIDTIKTNTRSKIILYFHNNPLTISGSKLLSERINLLTNCEYIFFNSEWTKNQFFKNLDDNEYKNKFGICYQSTKKSKVNIYKKKNIITFVGKLNSAKGYDVFGNSIIKILNKYPDWKSIVVGDEPREKHYFEHKNLKIYSFQDNKFVLNLLKKASISVACSRWDEPFGRSSLEACSMGCATIITNRGGLIETTSNPIILKKLNSNELFKLIENLINNRKKRVYFQKKNYSNFYLSHTYVSSIIDKVREKILSETNHKFYINKKSNLKIIHITNFNYRYFGRLQYNTGIRLNNGLIRLGHNILSLSDRDIISYSKSLRDPSGSKYLNKLILNTINNFKPDLIILGHADRVNTNTILEAKEKYKNIRVSQWFLDPLSKKGPDYEKNKSRILDKSIICDTSFITTDPNALDFQIKNSFFMPNPCDKSLDYLKNFENKPEYDLFYAISHGVHRGILRPGKNDEREIFIKKLKSMCVNVNFDTYGMFGKQPVWGDDFLKRLSNSKMALNLSRGKPVKYYSSDRLAQLMGNGLLTFINKNTCYNDFFTNKEMVFYNSIDDLAYKVKKFSKNDKEWREIAKRGHNKYQKFFNSSIVGKFIIDKTCGINSKYYWEK